MPKEEKTSYETITIAKTDIDVPVKNLSSVPLTGVAVICPDSPEECGNSQRAVFQGSVVTNGGKLNEQKAQETYPLAKQVV